MHEQRAKALAARVERVGADLGDDPRVPAALAALQLTSSSRYGSSLRRKHGFRLHRRPTWSATMPPASNR